MSQILPIMNLNVSSNVVENTTLQEQIYSVLPSCVYIEVEIIYEDWCGEDRSSEQSGSGVIISEDGFIVTAGHMIDNATKITVRLNDGRKFEAKNWRVETDADLGLIKIDSHNLLATLIGNSDEEFIGNSVFIIGCPFGEELHNTVTTGIISGIKRDIAFFGDELMLQVDSQAWFGNSGGGLFNSDSELIGVVVGSMRGYDGISLCIPSNIVKLMIDKHNSEQSIIDVRKRCAKNVTKKRNI